MNGDYFALKAQLSELKLKLCHAGLSLYDKPTTKEEIAVELEQVLQLVDQLEEGLTRKAPTFE
ncbi:hypothetical protein ACOJQI_15920 [Bacillus salacetis]|uniref:hypothetical protein n=1 Tax=Bacillus salacetis TaxID=2315464 RepID=UPI003BA00C7F